MTMERDEQQRRADLRRWICLVRVKGGVKSFEGKKRGAKGSHSSCPERLCLLQLSVTPLQRSRCAHSGSELLLKSAKNACLRWAVGAGSEGKMLLLLGRCL